MSQKVNGKSCLLQILSDIGQLSINCPPTLKLNHDRRCPNQEPSIVVLCACYSQTGCSIAGNFTNFRSNVDVCNLLRANCQSSYQCCDESLQSCLQKNIRFACNLSTLADPILQAFKGLLLLTRYCPLIVELLSLVSKPQQRTFITFLSISLRRDVGWRQSVPRLASCARNTAPPAAVTVAV